MRLLTIIWARPQFSTAATLSRVIKTHDYIDEVIDHTDNYNVANMSKVFFDVLDWCTASTLAFPCKPHFNVCVGEGDAARKIEVGLLA